MKECFFISGDCGTDLKSLDKFSEKCFSSDINCFVLKEKLK